MGMIGNLELGESIDLLTVNASQIKLQSLLTSTAQ
jgi:hypothetical protein